MAEAPPCSRCGKRPAKGKPSPGNVDRIDLCGQCLSLTCPDCGLEYLPSPGHCRGGRYGGCCRSFRTGADFDEHQVGRYEPHERRCLTDEELIEAGWMQVDAEGDVPSVIGGHFWLSPEGLRGIQRGRARRSKADSRVGVGDRATEAPNLDPSANPGVEGPQERIAPPSGNPLLVVVDTGLKRP